MSTGKPRDAAKERFWRQILRRWQRSGLPVRAFCEEFGLAEQSFYGWRRTLRQRDAQAIHFVPVQVIGQATALLGVDQSAHPLELVLSDGRRLRIGPGFDAATLQRLLALLEEGRPC
jgi:transposase-like protein